MLRMLYINCGTISRKYIGHTFCILLFSLSRTQLIRTDCLFIYQEPSTRKSDTDITGRLDKSDRVRERGCGWASLQFSLREGTRILLKLWECKMELILLLVHLLSTFTFRYIFPKVGFALPENIISNMEYKLLGSRQIHFTSFSASAF